MAKFRKAILKTGTYRSPDGEVNVTTDRLRHWSQQFNAMSKAKQVVPIDWDHGQTREECEALSLADYKKRRSAKNTVGRLDSFTVAKDGQSAEITLDVRDPQAIDRAKRNEVYVSPVLFPNWADGAGNEYSDVITHVDFVNHPVDHSQGEFTPAEPGVIACAIRMALSQPMRLAAESDDMDDEKDPDIIEEDAEPEVMDDTPEIPEVEEASPLGDVVSALAAMSIILPEDTDDKNFLDRLHTALLTAQAKDAEAEGEEGPPMPPPGGGDDLTMEEPPMATMSLQQRATVTWAEGQHRKDVARRLESVLSTGRCTPAEYKARKGSLPAVKLSLTKDGKPKSSGLEDWIASRESVPKGTFWSDQQKIRMSQVDPPLHLQGDLGDGDVDSTATWALTGKKS